MAVTPYEERKYTQSDAVTQAQQTLQDHQTNKPGDYTSQWQGQLNDTLSQIQNRPAFSYDVNTDALYQQVAQNYLQQGQQAMMDTMGQAAAMTGGYGNSYAQAAGQQMYNQYLQGLVELVPQYRQMALEQYQMEGEDLLNQYNMLRDQEDTAYNRYMDMVNQYYADLDRYQDAYDNEREFDYSKFTDDRDFDYGKYQDELEYQYQLDRDAIEDEQWQKEYEETIRQFDEELAETMRQFDEELAWDKTQYYDSSSSSSGGSSSSSGSSGYGYDTHGMSTAEIKALQTELGVTADGIWGPKTEAAYQAKYGGGGGDDTSFTQKLANVKTAGATEEERSQLVDEMVADGTIAPSQAIGLKHYWAKD